MLDQFFGNVCELDLVFNFYKVRVKMRGSQWSVHGAVVLTPDDRSTLSWTKSFSPARSKKQANRSCLRDWSILINWSSESGQRPASTMKSALMPYQHYRLHRLTQHSHLHGVSGVLWLSLDNIITHVHVHIHFFISKGVNSGDIKDQMSNRSFHNFGPNVEITDQSIVAPSFSTRILSL